MNIITQYGLCGLVLVLRVTIDFILQNTAPPYIYIYMYIYIYVLSVDLSSSH